ncbi:hypothetical protein LSAT2_001293, partial [Lamellibrachia satsuma]
MHLSVLQCVTTLAWIATLYVVVRAKQGELVEANSKFALSLYGNVCDDDANLVISPYSVSAAMAMTYAGSAGRTREELRRVLGYSRMRPWFIHKSFRDLLRKQRQTSKVYTLYVANRIFANRRLRINYTYQRIAMKYYGSSVKSTPSGMSSTNVFSLCRRGGVSGYANTFDAAAAVCAGLPGIACMCYVFLLSTAP